MTGHFGPMSQAWRLSLVFRSNKLSSVKAVGYFTPKVLPCVRVSTAFRLRSLCEFLPVHTGTLGV